MKQLLTLIIFLLVSIISLAQAQAKKDKQILEDNNQKNHTPVVYKLFPTQNMWTFIKLNTRNGLIWQVQYGLEGNDRFQSNLNLTALADPEKETNERFTLYPTQNIYNFILLDQIDGRMWQVQWSADAKNRGIIPIEKLTD